jgi:hypothetical protein
MGENTNERQSSAEALREQIRHTESDITETVQSLEERLSPRYLRQQGARKAKRLLWQGTAQLLALAQHTAVQASLVGGSVLWLILRNRPARHGVPQAKPATKETHRAASAAKAAGATGGLWMLFKKARERELVPAIHPPLSGLALAATAAKAFLTGARSSKKRGTTQPGRKVAWRGVATALGAALGSYWYSHKGHAATR